MTQDDKHNGWSNYATWRINLEICDDIASSLIGEQTFESVAELADYLEQAVDDVLTNFGEKEDGLTLDYARAFVSDVDFREIAESQQEGLITDDRETITFTARDIGYGVEFGEVYLPATDVPDWTGKRPYLSTHDGTTVYLFDDELDS